MYLNLFYPKKSVQSCIDRPNIRIAFLVVLVPVIVSLIGWAWLGLPMDAMRIGISVVGAILTWLILSIVFFVVLYLVRGNRMQGKFKSVASSLSLLWLVFLVLLIIGFVFVSLVFSAPILNEAKLLVTGQSSLEEYSLAVGKIIDANPQAISLEIGAIGVLIVALLILFSFYLAYLMVRDFYEGGFIKNFIVTIILLVLWMYIGNWLFVLL
ncbi:hypothetical protein KKE06_00630 [Candidatus Micrarchaeota archaeon]|nr:hypothetical protein [Candidatus Micrarchaeota archaeon]MBU1930308.1 hypothetical protein [Candidatus Micrarchaeota archaeon]